MENLNAVVMSLIQYPSETQWIEFKKDNYKPDMIGEDISVLANGAVLNDRGFAYFVWGIDDITHEVIGTENDLSEMRKGSQELESWLRNMLSKHADFEYQSTLINDKKIDVMKIRAAVNLPVSFENMNYIRIGSYTKKIKGYPAVEARLWAKLQNRDFEGVVARGNLTENDILSLLSIEAYFEKLKIVQPVSLHGCLFALESDGIIVKQDDGLYGITNLGAILFARKLSDFPSVSRKAIRIAQYADKSKVELLKDITMESGYAIVFENAMQYIDALLPSQEVIKMGIRSKDDKYSMAAIREILANALMHQDFSLTGMGPTVEIFSNRVEVTNPGALLVDVLRIVDTPPKSRNQKLSALMRRMKMCEELGSGWDKIVLACEDMCLPVAKIDLYEDSVRVKVFSKVHFSNMSIEDRVLSCYFHACVQFLKGEYLTNSSLRKRFGLDSKSSGAVSRVIKRAMEEKYICPFEEGTAPRYMKYVPSWA